MVTAEDLYEKLLEPQIQRLGMEEETRCFITQRMNGNFQNQHVNYCLLVAKLPIGNEETV